MERSFHIERNFVKGKPFIVEHNLTGACDEVYTYALVLNKAYQNLKYDMSKSKLCVTSEGGSSDSPDGVDMKDPNCDKPKDFVKATAESKFVKKFDQAHKGLLDLTKIITGGSFTTDACLDGLGIGGYKADSLWDQLESYENTLKNLRDEFVTVLGYEITTKDVLDEKPKDIATRIGDTVTSIMWGVGALVAGFFVLDYVYEKAPSKAVGERYQAYVKNKDTELAKAG